jgi:hypothetical protein
MTKGEVLNSVHTNLPRTITKPLFKLRAKATHIMVADKKGGF